MTRSIIGVYDRFEQAQAAIKELLERGFPSESINLVARQAEDQLPTDKPASAAEASETGAPADSELAGTMSSIGAGMGLGGLAGALVGLGIMAIPGIGPVLAVGPAIAAILGGYTGSVAGGVAGGMVAARAQWGMADEDMPYYLEAVRRGGAVLLVATEDERAALAEEIVQQHHPIDVKARAEDWRKEGWQPDAKDDTTNVPPVSVGLESTSDAAVRAGKMPGMPMLEALEPDFHEHYQRELATGGQPYEAYQLAYLYGYNLANDGRYRGARWADIEPLVREHWDSYQPGAWDIYREAVRFGLEHTLQRA